MSETKHIEISTKGRNKVVEMLQNGEKLAKIEGYLLFEHDLSTLGAKAYLTQVREELGIEGRTGSGVDLTALVAYMREHAGKMEKKDLIAGMQEVSSYTYSTAQHMYNYIAMAQEWARQSVADEAGDTAESESDES